MKHVSGWSFLAIELLLKQVPTKLGPFLGLAVLARHLRRWPGRDTWLTGRRDLRGRGGVPIRLVAAYAFLR